MALVRAAALALSVGLLLPTTPAAAAVLPGAPDCPIFPATNVWNKRVDGLPVRADSERLKKSIGLDRQLHPDFSSISGGNYGIPYNVVGAKAKRYTIKFTYADESDDGPYPIPARPKIENGSDRHLLVVERASCRLYELFDARRTASGGWRAGSGAIWDLRSNKLRPKGWTSADAAGLPILPGLVRYDEVAAGIVSHALRFTAPRTRRAYIYPARHYASNDDSRALPPMGLRVRLKASVSLRDFGPQARVVLRALKRYGMILADNGSPWYVTGAPDPGWDDDDLRALHSIKGSDFEVVDTSGLRNGP
ncbi:MAG TPA: hypothetical protein VNW68_01280 [Candidatus Limnocylindria bacterium]|jgi:opacity protein-like surface antigen|nr:hypothetical protein [Candidatus Limnocylindria bacterium]